MFTGSIPEQVNHRKLANENRKIKGAIPLSKFSRLQNSLENAEGEVRIKLEFRKGRKQKALVIGSATAEVTLICQRCIQPMQYELEAKVRHTIVSTEEILLEMSPDIDAILCTEDRIQLVSIFEDELIINLPMVSKHSVEEEKTGKCQAGPVHQNDDSPVQSETYKPFAALADIKNEIKRS